MNSPKLSQLAKTKTKNTSPLSARQAGIGGPATAFRVSNDLVHALDILLCVRGLEKGFHLNRLVVGFLRTHAHIWCS